jgi:very-short-patch-repair endonuclease
MTRQEIFLWRRICRKQICGVQFYRQKPIGPYIVDFFAKYPKIVIELDGGHHFEPEQEQKDIERDCFLRSLRIYCAAL